MKKFSKCIFFAEDFKLFAKFDQIQTHTFGEISGFQILPRRGLSNCRIFFCFLMEGSKIDVIFRGCLPCLIPGRWQQSHSILILRGSFSEILPPFLKILLANTDINTKPSKLLYPILSVDILPFVFQVTWIWYLWVCILHLIVSRLQYHIKIKIVQASLSDVTLSIYFCAP